MKVVSGKRFCQVLEKHGWVLQRVRGSHHVYEKAGNPSVVTVPVHGNHDLKRGMLRHLIKLTELDESEL